MLGSGSAIIGRDAELETLRSFVASDDGPGALIVEGEPGIGKTTLWRVGVDEARSRGIRVLACSPGSSETRLSFAALADLLGTP